MPAELGPIEHFVEYFLTLRNKYPESGIHPVDEQRVRELLLRKLNRAELYLSFESRALDIARNYLYRYHQDYIGEKAERPLYIRMDLNRDAMIVIVALILAEKMNNDFLWNNSSYASLLRCPTEEVNKVELQFLTAVLQYEANVTQEMLDAMPTLEELQRTEPEGPSASSSSYTQ